MWYVQGGTVAVRTVGFGTRNSESGLGVPLGSVEHGGRVARGLRGTLDIDPNPNGIVPLQRPTLSVEAVTAHMHHRSVGPF